MSWWTIYVYVYGYIESTLKNFREGNDKTDEYLTL